MRKVLALTTLHDSATVSSLHDQGCSVVPLILDHQLHNALDLLDSVLNRYPPTSLASAKRTWLPFAEKVGNLLTLQAAGAGESLEWDEIPGRFSRVLVISDRIIPVDLIPCRGTLLGIECIVAHIGPRAEADAQVARYLEDEELPLRRIAHVCSYDPGTTPLNKMDVISATLSLDNRLAIEHYFYPTKEVAAGLFQRGDIDILHFECHGTVSSLQVDNPYGIPIDVRDLHSSIGPSVYFFLGCSAGGDIAGVAPTFVRKGARASVGAYCRFLSGGSSGEVSVSSFYDTLYKKIVAGESLGESIRAGREAAAPDRIYYCAWLLFGNPSASFSVQKFGGATAKPATQASC